MNMHPRMGGAPTHTLTREQALREENEILREALRQVQDALVPIVSMPPAWRLSKSEARLLRALRATGTNILPKERALIAIYGVLNDRMPGISTTEVFIWRLRRKLRSVAAPVQIHTAHGHGWYLDRDSLNRLNAAIAAETEAPRPLAAGGARV